MKTLTKVLPTLLLMFLGTPAEAALRVVSTIPDLGAIAAEVGGDLVQVQSLVKPTQDPHFVDPKPSFVLDLNRADLLLVVGMELETGWLAPLVNSARNASIQLGGDGYLDCSKLIVPREVEQPDRAKGDIHPGGNPHYWFDPRNGLLLADGMAARLARLDPANAPQYQARCADFKARLQARMVVWKEALAPLQGRQVVVYHRSFVYLMDFLGFTEVGALEPKPGIPPGPSHVAQLVERAKLQKVDLMIQEGFYPVELSRIFAQQSGARLVLVPTMVGAQGTKTYIELVDRIVDLLKQP
jgi:zinc/manganese transport system substrate-binding protein